MKTRTLLKPIRSAKQATLRVFFILLTLPTATLAGVHLDNSISIDPTILLKVVSLIIASFLGGVSSSFFPTTFDDGMKNVKLRKIFVGTCLGAASGLMMIENTNYGVFSLFLPVFVIGSLATPIMFFYLSWFTSEDFQKILRNSLNKIIKKKTGIKDE